MALDSRLGCSIVCGVGVKNQKVAALVERFQGREWDPQYLGFFECFNQQLYFEAHEVLEGLWLKERGGPPALFYKGLIQLAGAFVHLQKERTQPAIALFGLARQNLKQYPDYHQGLNLVKVLATIDGYLEQLKSAVPGTAPHFRPEFAPRIFLVGNVNATSGAATGADTDGP